MLDGDGSYQNPRTNCASVSGAPYRVIRGGAFYVVASGLLAAYRSYGPGYRYDYIGARCARTP